MTDVYDEAMTEQASTFHGQITIEAFKVALKKGEKRQVYDPNVHKNDGWIQATAVSLHIAPLDPVRKFIDRETITFGAEWSKVIRPSIEALAAKIATIRGKKPDEINPLRELNNLWVAGEFVPRPDNKNGETWTTLKFTDVFATEAECAAHAAAAKTANGNVEPQPVTQQVDPQRAALAAFLPALWAQAGKDAKAFEALLKANPVLVAFTMDSPEVKAAMHG